MATTLTTTTIDAILRPFHDELQMGLRLLTPEWKRLKMLENFKAFSNRTMRWPVILQYGGGAAWTVDGGSLARASTPPPTEATDSWRHLVKRFQLSHDAIHAGRDSRFADYNIEEQMAFQTKMQLYAFKRAIAIGFYGTSNNTLFKVSAVDAANNTITLKDLYGQAGLLPKRIRDYISKGQDVAAFLNPVGPAERGRKLVSGITESTTAPKIAYTGADISGVAVNDLVVLANHSDTTTGGTDYGRGLNGLLTMIRATTLHGINTADWPDWAPAFNENLGAVLGGEKLYGAFETIEQRSGHPVQWIYTTIGVAMKAGGQELDQRRYGPKDDEMRLGFKKINVMGVIVDTSPYVVPKHVFIGSNTALRKMCPDADVEMVVDQGAEYGDGVQQYTDTLGGYKDEIMRVQLCANSRLGLGMYSNVTDA